MRLPSLSARPPRESAIRRTLLFLCWMAPSVVGGACAGPSSPAPERAFRYGVDSARTVSYRLGDTATVTVNGGGGGSFGVSIRARGLLAMTMIPQVGGGALVEVDFRQFQGTMSSPLAGTVDASEEEIEGDLVFTLNARGGTRVEEEPELGGQAGQLLSPGSLARELFPRLPARAPEPGEPWRDTLSYSTGGSGPRTSAELVRSYTLVGDTTVDGRRLLRIEYEGTARYRVRGARMGMEMSQELEGPVRGTVHWDPSIGLPVRSRSTKELTGTMEIPAVGAPPMGLRLNGTTTLRAERSTP